MANRAKILGIDPVYAIAGGEIIIDCVGFDTRDPQGCGVLVGDAPAQIVAIGPRRVLAIVPETRGGELEVRLQSGADDQRAGALDSRAQTRGRSSSCCQSGV